MRTNEVDFFSKIQGKSSMQLVRMRFGNRWTLLVSASFIETRSWFWGIKIRKYRTRAKILELKFIPLSMRAHFFCTLSVSPEVIIPENMNYKEISRGVTLISWQKLIHSSTRRRQERLSGQEVLNGLANVQENRLETDSVSSLSSSKNEPFVIHFNESCKRIVQTLKIFFLISHKLVDIQVWNARTKG